MKGFLTGAAAVVIIASSVFIYNIFSPPYLILRNGDTGKVIAVYPVNGGRRVFGHLRSFCKQKPGD